MDIDSAMNFLRNIGEGSSGGLTTYASALPIWAGRKASKEYRDITLKQALELARAHNKAMNEQNPIAGTLGGMVGVAMPLGLVGGTGVKGVLKATGASGALGASQAMSQTGDPVDAALGGAIGTIAGAGGAVLTKALPIIGNYVKGETARRVAATGAKNEVQAAATGAKNEVMDFIKGLPTAAVQGAISGATLASTTGQDPLKGAAVGALGGMGVLKLTAGKAAAKAVAIPIAETFRTNPLLTGSAKAGARILAPYQGAPTNIADKIDFKNQLNANGTFPQTAPVEVDEFEQYRANAPTQSAAPSNDEFEQYRNGQPVPQTQNEDDEFAQYRIKK